MGFYFGMDWDRWSSCRFPACLLGWPFANCWLLLYLMFLASGLLEAACLLLVLSWLLIPLGLLVLL